MKKLIMRKLVCGRFYYYLSVEMIKGKPQYFWTGLENFAMPLNQYNKGWLLRDMKEQNINDIVQVIKVDKTNSDVSV